MGLKEFLKIYPDAQIVSSPTQNKLSFFIEGVWVELDGSALNASEIQLLDFLIPKNNHQSVWFNHLVKHKPLHTTVQSVFFIHFYTENFEQQNLWLETLHKNMNALDCFFVDHTMGVLVLSGENPFELDSFIGLLDILDDDFGTTSSFYIGSKHSVSHSLPEVFYEEFQLFSNHKLRKRMQTFSEVLIAHRLAPSLKEHPLTKEIINTLNLDSDMIQLIRTLWHTQGNISQAAVELFLHRNTLIYRIERLYQQTHLNLRDLNDLLLCYLLTI